MLANLGLDGLDIGKRIGEPHGAAGERSGNIEEGDAESGAAALVAPCLPAEGSDEFGAMGVVLHVSGIRFGVGQYFSGSIDDGSASACSKALLGSDFSEWMGVIDFDAVGKEKSFLGEVALDFGAQRGLPGIANHDV